MSNSSHRQYVNRWEMTGSPQPFVSKNMTGYGFVLEGQLDKLQALCSRYLTAPTNGQFEYSPVSHYVLLTFSQAQTLASCNKPYSEMGCVPEAEAALWVLTEARKRGAAAAGADHLAWFIPYVFVDNPVALISGREIYGFPKEMGWFELPADEQNPVRFTAETIAVKKFGPRAPAARQQLLAVDRTKPPPSGVLAKLWETLEDTFAAMKLLLDEAFIAIPGMELAEDVFRDVTKREVSMVFLKQLFDAQDGNCACYQAIVEAPVKIARFRGARLLHGEYQVAIHPFDSHPICAELGLKKQQQPLLSYWLNYDFTFGAGTNVCTAP